MNFTFRKDDETNELDLKMQDEKREESNVFALKSKEEKSSHFSSINSI